MAVSCRHMVHLFLVGITFLMAGSFIIAAPPTATTPANDLSCLQLSPRDETHMVQSTASAIFHGDARKLFLPTSYTQDTAPRQVFITLNDGKSPARVIDSTGYGIAKALGSAVGQAIQLTKQHFTPIWLKLDIPVMATRLTITDTTQPLPLRPGIDGLVFGAPLNISFLPEEVAAYELLTTQGTLNSEKVIRLARLHNPALNKGTTTLPSTAISFVTLSYFTDGHTVLPLFRGHRLVKTFTRNDLLTAARQGGDYLQRNENADGSFAYVYEPYANRVSDDYNLVRHAGTVYGMLELYRATKDHALLKKIKQAISFLASTTQPCKIGAEETSCIVMDGRVPLGGNALAALALATYTQITHDKQYMPLLTRLGRWMELNQQQDGNITAEVDYASGKPIRTLADYYPGEAIFALTRIYSVDHQAHWLDCAEKQAQYLINVRDKGLSDTELSHDHWFLYGINELYRSRQNPIYFDHAMRIVRAIMSSQQHDQTFADYIGSFDRRPESAPTATRIEGLCAAYQLARDYKYPQKDLQAMRASIESAIRFQLGMQYRPESVIYFPNPARTIGGFPASFANESVRIDFVQHSISALLGMYRIMADH